MPSPILAEVSDKMMSLPTLIVWNVVLVLVARAVAEKSRWFALIPFSLATVLALSALEELRDPFVGPAVIHELGYRYAALSFLPLIVVATIAARKRKNA
jgi:ABC-type Co2+ transport system permease subunit